MEMNAAWNNGPAAQTRPRYIPAPDSLGKFIALSIGSFGIYPALFIYRQWKYFRDKYAMDISPIWRTVFGYFWIYPLFRLIRDDLEKQGGKTAMQPAVSAFLFFLISITYRLPEPWSLIALSAFLPLIPVAMAARDLAAMEPANEGRGAMGGWEWIIAIMGGAMVAFTILITFFPIPES